MLTLSTPFSPPPIIGLRISRELSDDMLAQELSIGLEFIDSTGAVPRGVGPLLLTPGVVVRNGVSVGMRPSTDGRTIDLYSKKTPTGYTDLRTEMFKAQDVASRIAAVEQWLADNGLVPVGAAKAEAIAEPAAEADVLPEPGPAVLEPAP